MRAVGRGPTFGSFSAQLSSRTWYWGVRFVVHGDVPAPPSELWLPAAQQRWFWREQGVVAPVVALPPQQNSVPTPGHGWPCCLRQVSAGAGAGGAADARPSASSGGSIGQHGAAAANDWLRLTAFFEKPNVKHAAV